MRKCFLKISSATLACFMVFSGVLGNVHAYSNPTTFVEKQTQFLITDLTIDKTEAKPGDEVTVIAKSNIKVPEGLTLRFEFNNGTVGQNNAFKYDEATGYYVGKFTVDNATAPGNYKLTKITLTTEMTSEEVNIGNFDLNVTVENSIYQANRPKVVSVTGLKKDYNADDKLAVDIEVSSKTTLNQEGAIIFTNKDDKELVMMLTLKDNHYVGEMTVPKNIVGQWNLERISIASKDENFTRYLVDEESYQKLNISFIINEEVKDDDKAEVPESPESNQNTLPKEDIQNAVSNISNAKPFSAVTVDMKDSTVVPKDILEAAKGKDVQVVLQMDGYKWTIHGKDIDSTQNINLEVNFGLNNIPSELKNESTSNNPYQEISLTHNGEFGFKANLQMQVDSKYAGLYANLYYFTNNGLEYMSNSIIDTAGYVSLDFSHASDYLLIMKPKENTPINNSDNSQKNPNKETQHPVDTADVSQMLYLSSLLGVSGLGVVKALKRKEK